MIATLLVRIMAAAIFIVSGFVKLMEPHENFLAVIHSFDLVGGRPAELISVGLPWVELVFGVFLLAGLWTRLSSGVLWLLSSAFLAVIGSAMFRKLPIDQCGCFGKSLSLPIGQMLFVDLGLWLTLSALFIFSEEAGRVGLDGRWRVKP